MGGRRISFDPVECHGDSEHRKPFHKAVSSGGREMSSGVYGLPAGGCKRASQDQKAFTALYVIMVGGIYFTRYDNQRAQDNGREWEHVIRINTRPLFLSQLHEMKL